MTAALPASNESRLLLTVPETCAQLRISRWSFYRLVQRRQLTTIKIGGRRLVPTASLGDFIARQVAEEVTTR